MANKNKRINNTGITVKGFLNDVTKMVYSEVARQTATSIYKGSKNYLNGRIKYNRNISRETMNWFLNNIRKETNKYDNKMEYLDEPEYIDLIPNSYIIVKIDNFNYMKLFRGLIENYNYDIGLKKFTDAEGYRVTFYGKNPKAISELYGDNYSEYRTNRPAKDKPNISVYIPKLGTSPLGAKVKKRFADTIFNDKIDSIMEVVNNWKANEELYNKFGRPWKLNILLYGPPGTGKTSIAYTIASELDFKMKYYSDMVIASKGITEYTACKSLILFDDFDLYLGKRSSTDKGSNMVIERALTVLDGTLSHGEQVMIATTNDKDSLDEAIIRPGRFDMIVYIGEIEEESIAKRMCDHYEVSYSILDELVYPINPAKLEGLIYKEKSKEINNIKGEFDNAR